MKTRLATLTAILATATLALTACAGGSGSATQSEQTTQETTASSTRTITDHAGNEVVLPSTIHPRRYRPDPHRIHLPGLL